MSKKSTHQVFFPRMVIQRDDNKNKLHIFQIKSLSHKKKLQPSIHPSAVLPNLSIWSSEWADISHLDHPCYKISIEVAPAVAVLSHYRISGTPIEQLLIRVEKSFLLDQVLVVVVLKSCRSLKIQRGQVVVPWATGSWAVALPCFSEGIIDVCLIIYASPEGCAPCLPNCVWAWLYSTIVGSFLISTFLGKTSGK